MSTRFRGDDPASKVEVHIRSVKGGENLFVRTLTDRYWSCFTHFVAGAGDKSGKSHYCTLVDDSRCLFCGKHEQTWKGYTPADVYVPGSDFWMPVVLELTERMEADMRHTFGRGQVWELTRKASTRKRKNFPTFARLTETIESRLLPPPFDVTPILTRYFHRTPKALDIPNPMPLPVMMNLSGGGAPKALQERRQHEQPEGLDSDSKAHYEEQRKKLKEMGFLQDRP